MSLFSHKPRRLSSASGLGVGALFFVTYIAAASSVYFALGVIAEDALGLTPLVFLVAGIFFAITFLSYVEGSSLHIERGGASTFARYAFDEFWSFVAGWAIILDYVIVLALIAFTVPHYMEVFWSPIDGKLVGSAVSIAVICAVAITNVRGITARHLRRALPIGALDLTVQMLLVVVGISAVWNPSALVDTVSLGVSPTWEGLLNAAIFATVAYTGLEAASGLAGEIRIGRAGLQRALASSIAAVMSIYVGISVIALMALAPTTDSAGVTTTPLAGGNSEAPLIGVVSAFHPDWLATSLKYLVATVATLTLFQAAKINLLGPVRLTYALATNRQIPSVIGRLHSRHNTPVLSIVIVSALSIGLVLTAELERLVSIYAFGALITYAIAHLAICVLRYREPDAPSAFRVPLSIKLGSGRLPLLPAIAFVASICAWLAVVVMHHWALIVGGSWMVFGISLYVIYRRTQGKSLRTRVSIPETDLRQGRSKRGASFATMLVPIFGGRLDDDIMGTAGRLAMEEVPEGEGGAVIEAIHVIEVPMTQALDAPIPEERRRAVHAMLAHAKEVGEEYENVEVATAIVRARATGEAIVREAARRGVDAIVLAAERPSRIRGGSLLGGISGADTDFIGKVTEYVARKATCRVILTAPPETNIESLVESFDQNPHRGGPG